MTMRLDRCAAWVTAMSLAALIGVAGCKREPEVALPGSGTPPLAETETRAFRACVADSDCVYVQNGCCDCVNGGEATAVHRDRVQAFKAKLDCSHAECTARGAIPGCDEGTATCKAGLCDYERAR